jgi:hypothetical protein
LRALAGLGVVHEPDFTQEVIDALAKEGGEITTETQLSRSGAPEAVGRYGGALMTALMYDHSRFPTELMHVARYGTRGQRGEILAAVRDMRSV